MSSSYFHIGALAHQATVSREKRRFGVRAREVIPAVLLFVVLVLQLWVRLTITARGYELERLRTVALEKDLELRQARLDYAYQTRPNVLHEAAERRLGMKTLFPQHIRKINLENQAAGRSGK